MVQIVPGYPQIILPNLLHSLSGLLSFLAAALARKYVLQVLPSFCATFSNVHVMWHAFLNPERSLPEDE